MTSSVTLEDAEWNAVLNMIAMGAWREANPLLMKIGDQLRKAKEGRIPELGDSYKPETKLSVDGARLRS